MIKNILLIHKNVDSQKLWKKYMNTNKNIQSFFYKCDPNITSDVCYDENTQTIYVKHEENYMPGILFKTIKTFHYIYKNYDFDYIYRTNMSSVIDLNKIDEYILNNKMDFGGVIGDHRGFKFVSGAEYFLSKMAYTKLLINNANIPYNVMDDLAIAFILQNYFLFTPVPRGNIDSLDSDEINIPYEKYSKDTFHFRCKSENSNDETVKIQQILLKKIYPEIDFKINS